MKKKFDVLIIGAGAAGLMCAIEAGKRNKKVLVIEHTEKIGEKIRISGGGKCNFTNLNINKENFISSNQNFCISALNQYTQNDFIRLVESYNISFHEKKLGQLFCNNSSKDIINMLLKECKKYKINFNLKSNIRDISKLDIFFLVSTYQEIFKTASIVVASGGLSIPKIGATDIGYEIAKKFNIRIKQTKPGLVPFKFNDKLLSLTKELSGISVDCEVSLGKKKSFTEGLLFTHKGISGPSVLQISSYWNDNQVIKVNLLPELNNLEINGFNNVEFEKLINKFPKRLSSFFLKIINLEDEIKNVSKKKVNQISQFIRNWAIIPNKTEGYSKAEVTVGGIDTDELSSKTFEAKKVKGLFFIGEVIDVTGQLGGYNFQWAWSSGFVAGKNV